MSYKTILVHTDQSAGTTARIAFAAQLAGQYDAHLIGVTDTGIARFVYESAAPGLDFAGLTPLIAELHEEATQRARRFDTLARQAGLTSFEHRIGDDEPGNALATQALYADLVVVGQTDPEGAGALPGIPEYVAMNAPCPVIVVPYTGSFEPGFARILIGWNASPEAARAVRQALPLLTRAAEVEVAVCDGAEVGGPWTALGGDDIALYLARHGVKTELWQGRAGGDVAAVLLSRAEAFQADLLVMGCYGHSRFREILLGGVSRTVLRSMVVPTLLAH